MHPSPAGWESWVRTLSNSTNPHDTDLLIAKIKDLLAKREAKLVEKVEGMKDRKDYRTSEEWPLETEYEKDGYNSALDAVLRLLKGE
jgi:hypothetical protein